MGDPTMLDQLFHYPRVLERHRKAPLLVEREQFLQHCATQGMARTTLTSLATELSVIAQRLEVSVADGPVEHRQIDVAAKRWARYQCRRGRSRGLRWPRERFVQVATDWLGFLHRLQVCEPEPSAGAEWIEQFAAYMQEERGLSPATIHDSRWHTEKFFRWLAAQSRTLAEATITDVDAFLESLGQRGWCRVSVVKGARTLRAFFRYAEQRGWCPAGMAAGIVGPRIFRDEGIPVGPQWSDVERLISSTEGDIPHDIRDRAILQLFSIYGFRSGEVAGLRLEDLNWSQDRILVNRRKQRRRQEYPLLPVVGESILRYLEQVRPSSAYREVFLTLKVPIQPISAGAMYHLVSERMRALEIRSIRQGPHALRHACAGRLVAQGLSLKQIGDHLGHRSVFATRTYAKVDLAGLREVADFSLGGLL
jgi:integrase/recombinase XerD